MGSVGLLCQFFYYMFCKMFVYFVMSWDRLFFGRYLFLLNPFSSYVQGKFFDLMLLWDILHSHQSVGVFHVFFKFVQCFYLASLFLDDQGVFPPRIYYLSNKPF